MTTLDLKFYQATQDQNTPTLSGTTAEQTNTETGEKTVTLSGPLSQVYAQALISALGENTIQYVGETNSIEASALMMLQNQESNLQDDSVIYVNDQEHITDSPAQSYDDLRIALDQKASKHIVVLESRSVVSKPFSIMADYAASRGAKVYFSRKAFLNAL